MHENCKEGSCENKALSLCEYCWEHIKDKKGYIASLEAHNKSGKSMEGFHLKGLQAPAISLLHATLKEADLSGTFLQGADFSGANLSYAGLVGSNLSVCDFVGADCANANFMMADLSRARLWHADMTNTNLSEANLKNTDFLNSVLFNCNLYHADLKEARFLTKENFRVRTRAEGVSEKSAVSARESYANLKQYFMAEARYNDLSWASFNENRMELKRLWEERRPGYLPFLLMGFLCGWGERPLRATISAISIIILYAVIFFVSNAVVSAFPVDADPSFLDYIYYSSITFTTVGYGDLLPKANAVYRLLAGSEAFIGIFMMGLFVFSLGRRYAAR